MRASPRTILLLSSNPDLQAHLGGRMGNAVISSVGDLEALKRFVSGRKVHGIILDTSDSRADVMATLKENLDPSRMFFLAASESVLREFSYDGEGEKTSETGDRGKRAGRQFHLEDYVEFKFQEFIKGMKHGSASNLYPMLIRALERPLIRLALEETAGNQIQAAHLLGMNRNTLRKKIAEHNIPLSRGKRKQAMRASDS